MTQRTLLQAFHWYYPGEGRLWPDVEEKAASPVAMGITDVWLSPVYKGSAVGLSVGYDVYDLFDGTAGRRHAGARRDAGGQP
ncbi:MAG: amyA [Proteobacteria bacterium]|nr:amyA [Pseudomonadota bacterium]